MSKISMPTLDMDLDRKFWQDPDASFSQNYAPPDPQTFVFDPRLGYYYDDTTGFYYDSQTDYYYNPETRKWLYWCNARGSYRPAEEDDKEVNIDKGNGTEPAKVTREEVAVINNENSGKKPIKASELLEISQQMYNTWKEQQKYLSQVVIPSLNIGQQKILKSYDSRMETLAEVLAEASGAELIDDEAVLLAPSTTAAKHKIPTLFDPVMAKRPNREPTSPPGMGYSKNLMGPQARTGGYFFNGPASTVPYNGPRFPLQTPSAATLGTRPNEMPRTLMSSAYGSERFPLPRPLNQQTYAYGEPSMHMRGSSNDGFWNGISDFLEKNKGPLIPPAPRPLFNGPAGMRPPFNGPAKPIPKEVKKLGNTTLVVSKVKGGSIESFLPPTDEEVKAQIEKEREAAEAKKLSEQEEAEKINRDLRDEIARELTGEDPLSQKLAKFVPNGDGKECLKAIKIFCKRCTDFGHMAADCPNEAEPDRKKMIHLTKLIKLYKRKQALDDEDRLRQQVASGSQPTA